MVELYKIPKNAYSLIIIKRQMKLGFQIIMRTKRSWVHNTPSKFCF